VIDPKNKYKNCLTAPWGSPASVCVPRSPEEGSIRSGS
jgi:hypothetical protein